MHLLAFLISMLISIAIIPLMVRNAAALGMIDMPDPRKVHLAPIPRVGGVGIVLGAMIPMLLMLQIDATIAAFLLGAVVLFAFGIWDDVKELGHYVKFIGQFFAAVAVVYFGDLYVLQFPLLGEIPAWFGKPFSVIAIVGVINAINHSDGLDGLAGGESLLSLATLGYFFYLSESNLYLLITLSTIGGIFGFLRFNSHPARVFMGDGGSQFIGFTLAFLVLALTQRTNPAISPSIPLLIIGLPIIDILSVFYLRARAGKSWFRATRNHIHHRLLDFGFHHYAVVSIIYSIQAALTGSAIVLAYEYDLLLLALYLLICVLLFGIIMQAEKLKWHVDASSLRVLQLVPLFYRGFGGQFHRVSGLLLISAVPVLLLLSSTMVESIVETDVEEISVALFLILLIALRFEKQPAIAICKVILFVAIALVVYITEMHGYTLPWLQRIVEMYVFGVIFLLLPIRMRLEQQNFFLVSPLDYLVVLVVLLAGLINGYENNPYIIIAVKLAILFYCAEWILHAFPKVEKILYYAAAFALFFMGGRLFV